MANWTQADLEAVKHSRSAPFDSASITVYGTPGPQGSKSFKGFRKGKPILVESSKKVKTWRQSVEQAALEYLKRNRKIFGPVILEVTFTMIRPQRIPKGRAPVPDRTPDLSKLVRSTEDALTIAGVWEDDGRVVETIARKVYPGGHPNALPMPGAVIHVRPFVLDAPLRLTA